MLTVADRGGKNGQKLADLICERSLKGLTELTLYDIKYTILQYTSKKTKRR